MIYFQVCTGCKIVSNIGKTNDLRKRTNVHISSCRNGDSPDRFDNHVYACKKSDNEPYFNLWIFMEVNNVDKLLVYESYFHKKGYDTLNRDRAKV